MFSLITFFKEITSIYVALLLVSTNLFAKAFLFTPGRTRGFVKPKGNKQKLERRRASGASPLKTQSFLPGALFVLSPQSGAVHGSIHTGGIFI